MEIVLKYGETWLDLTFPATRTLLIRNYSRAFVVRPEVEHGNIHGCIKVGSQFYRTDTHRLKTVNFPTAVFFFACSL
jgi:hypothetical protein